MRRAIELLVLFVFIGIGLAAIFGTLPLPQLSMNSLSLGPIEERVEDTSDCASCTADCPLAGGENEDEAESVNEPERAVPTDLDRVPVHDKLLNNDELPASIADAKALPLPGGVITDTRRGVADGRERIWIDIATSSPVDEATDWYETNLAEAGWEMREDQPGVVPEGEFFSFEREEITLNVLFQSNDRYTRIFVDYPQ